MTIYDKFRDENLQYDSNRDVAKILGKIDKCEYVTGEELLPSHQS